VAESRGKLVGVLGAGLLLVACGGGLAMWRPWEDAPQASPPETPSARPPARMRLEATGPRSAKVWLDAASLGSLEIGPTGSVSGDALIKLPTQSRRLVGRDVTIVSDPGLDPRLSEAVQRLLLRGGTTSVVAPVDTASLPGD